MKIALTFLLVVSSCTTLLSQSISQLITAHYHLNGGAIDVSGNGLDGQVYGPMVTADRLGNPGQALLFDGVDDSVILNSNSPIITTSTFSIVFWVKLLGPAGGPLNRNMVFCQRTNATGSNNPVVLVSMGDAQGDFRFALRGSQSSSTENLIISGSQFNVGQWYHIACTYDQNGIAKVFVDGSLKASLSLSISGNFSDNVDVMTLGKYKLLNADQGFFNGALDELIVFESALSELQIDSLYNGLWVGLKTIEEVNNTMMFVPSVVKAHSQISIVGRESSMLHQEGVIRIFAATGRLIQSQELKSPYQFSIGSRGLYFVEFWASENKKIGVGKIIVY